MNTLRASTRLQSRHWAGLALLALLWAGAQESQAQATGLDSSARRDTKATETLRVSGPAGQPVRHNIVKINPLGLLVSSFSVFYERRLAPQLSVVLGYGCTGKDFGFSSQLENGKYAFRRGTVEVRHYWGVGLRGWYAGPYLRAGRLLESSYVDNPPGQHITGGWQTNEAFIWVPGIVVGHQLVGRWFTAEAFAGLQGQVVSGSLTGSNEVVKGLTSAVALRAGLTFGIPFK